MSAAIPNTRGDLSQRNRAAECAIEERCSHLHAAPNGRRIRWCSTSRSAAREQIANARIDTRAGAVATSGLDEDQFLRLDRNDDGLISRAEWGRFRSGFNQRDANRDGLLSRRELGLSDQAAVGTAGNGDFVIVSGTERWTDTGLTLRVGDRVAFDAEGTIQMSPDPNDTADPAGSRRLAPDAPLRTRAAGSLIARIGDSAPILVGARRTFAAPGSGRLYLSVNDDYLGDNSGEFRARHDQPPVARLTNSTTSSNLAVPERRHRLSLRPFLST